MWPSSGASLEVVVDAVQLRPAVHGAHVGVLVQRIAHAEAGEAVLKLLDHLRQDRLLHEEPGAGAANLALVEVDAADDAFDGLVEAGVLKDDVGGLAAQFEREFLEVACCRGCRSRFGDLLSDFG